MGSRQPPFGSQGVQQWQAPQGMGQMPSWGGQQHYGAPQMGQQAQFGNYLQGLGMSGGVAGARERAYQLPTIQPGSYYTQTQAPPSTGAAWQATPIQWAIENGGQGGSSSGSAGDSGGLGSSGDSGGYSGEA